MKNRNLLILQGAGKSRNAENAYSRYVLGTRNKEHFQFIPEKQRAFNRTPKAYKNQISGYDSAPADGLFGVSGPSLLSRAPSLAVEVQPFLCVEATHMDFNHSIVFTDAATVGLPYPRRATTLPVLQCDWLECSCACPLCRDSRALRRCQKRFFLAFR